MWPWLMLGITDSNNYVLLRCVMDLQTFTNIYVNASEDVRNQIREIVSIAEALPVCRVEDLISADPIQSLPEPHPGPNR